jgi:hypothetical protein
MTKLEILMRLLSPFKIPIGLFHRGYRTFNNKKLFALNSFLIVVLGGYSISKFFELGKVVNLV